MSGAAIPGPSSRAPRLALLALMAVCFVDVMGQGLAFPIFHTLLLCGVIAAFVAVPSGPLALALLLPAGALHGIGYPTLLAAYSRSAAAEEQGWVMGFSTAVFTLAAAIVSFLGGELTASSAAAPFLFALVCGGAAVLAALTIWRPQRLPGAASP